MTAFSGGAGNTTVAPDLPTAANPRQGTTSLTAVYPYTPPSSGQIWPRPY